jgi:putative endonuclease
LSSVTHVKQRRLIFAARHFLARLAVWPACRFDVVAVEHDELQWYKAAFDASA